MRWRGRRESSNIEDQRGQSRGGGGFRFPGGLGRRPSGGGGVRRAGGGGGMRLIILLGIIFFGLQTCDNNPLDMLTGGGNVMPKTGQNTAPAPQPIPRTIPQTQNKLPQTTQRTRSSDEMGQFVGVVLAETEKVWRGIFKQQGKTYPEPKLVLFTDTIRSGCGNASAASGPFYCPGDQKIYLDTAFFKQLERQFRASGDFAQAYVIAHEVGHHVQNVIGVLPKFNQMRQRMTKQDANQMSIRVELQADCFAGVWAHYTEQKGLLERGDIEEALNAATQIGDDAIQRRTQGYVVPESFSHGTSQQRKAWFHRGYESGKIRECDTKIFG